jgi:DNA invertase Pin-like site-specific DNA recombinase
MPPTGRPPGRPLTGFELRRLQLLLQTYDRARLDTTVYAEQLEDFVLECRSSGASARGMAAALGVSSTTVHKWTKNAKRRRQE